MPIVCVICREPLSEIEVALKRLYHPFCRLCAYCQTEIPTDIVVSECLARCIPISHFECRERQLIAEIRDKAIPSTKDQCDLLNDKILAFNQIPLDVNDIDILSDFLNSLTSLAANVSSVLGKSREKLKIRDLRKGQEQLAKAASVEAARSRQEESKKQQRAIERANPAIRDRRKAIEGFIALGISVEQATEMVDKMKGN